MSTSRDRERRLVPVFAVTGFGIAFPPFSEPAADQQAMFFADTNETYRNVASAPLHWIARASLQLLSFIGAFDRPRWHLRRGRALAAAAGVVCSMTAVAVAVEPIDRRTLDEWSAPYRGWHYHADPVIPADLKIPGSEAFRNFDVPTVYRIPGQEGTWYLSFIGFDGRGYNSFVCESTNLVDWHRPRPAMGFGRQGEFDFGGCVVGGYLYQSYDIKAPRLLAKRDGKYWTLYGCYPRQGGYELEPGAEGLASSDDGLTWTRARATPILSVHDADCAAWENASIYQPWLVEHDGTFFNFYNAKGTRVAVEQLGGATSANLLDWKRFPHNPVVSVSADGYDAKFCADAKVFRDGDHWVMFYFGVGRGGAHIMAAFSRDLRQWTPHPEPLYKAGGHPHGLDRQYAHKISLVYDAPRDTFFMYYCAVGTRGRCIGLLTSRPLEAATKR